VTVATVDDAVYEGAETFTLTASSSIVEDDATGAGTIVDDGSVDPDGPGGPLLADDDRPTLSVDSVEVSEGSDAVFTVTVGGVREGSIDVDLTPSAVGGSAEVDDIEAPLVVRDQAGTVISANPDGSYTLGSGVTSLSVEVPTTDDAVYEGDETFTLTASAGEVAVDGVCTGTIVDDGSVDPDGPGPLDPDNDRPLVSVVVSDDNAVEGTANNTVSFTVIQNTVSDFDTDIIVNLDLGTVEAADLNAAVTYLDSAGASASTTVAVLTSLAGLAITIPAGINYAPVFEISAVNDVVFEGSETLSLEVAVAAGETNAAIGTASAEATIYDEDSVTPAQTIPGNELGDAPTLTIGDAAAG
jgi:hypothetical protein